MSSRPNISFRITGVLFSKLSATVSPHNRKRANLPIRQVSPNQLFQQPNYCQVQCLFFLVNDSPSVFQDKPFTVFLFNDCLFASSNNGIDSINHTLRHIIHHTLSFFKTGGGHCRRYQRPPTSIGHLLSPEDAASYRRLENLRQQPSVLNRKKENTDKEGDAKSLYLTLHYIKYKMLCQAFLLDTIEFYAI